MGERLTKEREAEIRRVVDKMGFHPTPALVRDLLAEIDALRAAPPTTYLRADGTEEPIGELVARLTRERDGWRLRADDLTSQRDGQERDAIAARAEAGAERKARMAMEARVRELLDAHAKLLDRLETAKARVRELEAERAGLVTAEAYGQATAALAETRAQLERMARRERLLVEEVNGLREEAQGLEAQLVRLREAAGAYLTAASDGQADTLDPRPDVVRAYDAAERALRAALSTPGPTLASIRAEALRTEAARWDAMSYTTEDGAVMRPQPSPDALRQRADEIERGEGEVRREADVSGDDTVLGVAIRRLRGALSTPGPTLAEIRRAAQVEVLRDAVDTACDAVLAAVPCCNGTAAVHAVRRSLEKRADDLEAGR